MTDSRQRMVVHALTKTRTFFLRWGVFGVLFGLLASAFLILAWGLFLAYNLAPGLGETLFWPLFSISPLGLLAWTIRALTRTMRVEITARGISVVSSGDERIISYRDIAEVKRVAEHVRQIERTLYGVVLGLRTGENIDIVMSVSRPTANGSYVEEPAASGHASSWDLAEAIDEARKLEKPIPATTPAPTAETWTAQGERSLDEWSAGLRALGNGDGSYRTAGPGRSALWEVLQNSAADESARAGAAIVLGTDATANDRRRIRVALEEATSPRVRVAMQAALDDANEDRVSDAVIAFDVARSE